MTEEAPVLIRAAKAEDAPAIHRFFALQIEEGLDTVSNEPPVAAEDERERIRRTNERGTMLVAVANGQIVGVLGASTSERPSRAHVSGLGMSVAKAWRRRGIGRRLLQAAIENLKARPGICRIELEVVPWNAAAIALYESCGFLHEARKIKAINFRGRPEDMLLMALTW